MDIFILRNGEQTGPFSDQSVEALIAKGGLRLQDMAWRKGLPAWLPLSEVLNPGSEKPTEPPPAMQVSGVRPASPIPMAPTAKQKALLKFLGVDYSNSASKEDAALLISDALENPKLQARLAKWGEEKFRLHTDVFADEFEYRKANRAPFYMERCQHEGDGVVRDVTKAHCQVLVESLDKRYPHWEKDPKEALWSYFFPAIAEHFPALVVGDWKSKLRFGSAPKPPTPGNRRPAVGDTAEAAKAPGPLQAAIRGVVYGLAALGVIIGSMQLMKSAETKPADQPAAVGKTAGTSPAVPVSAPPPELPPAAIASIPASDPGANPQPETPPALEPAPTPPEPVVAVASVPATPPMVEPAAPPVTPAVPPVNPVPPGLPSLPRVEGTPAAPVVAPPAPTVPTLPPVAPVAPTPPAAAKSVITLTKPVSIQLQFGRVTYPPGTRMRFIATDPAGLKCSFNNSIVVVPVASTDYDGTAIPAVPALPPGIPAPGAAATPPAPKPVTPSDL